MKLYRKTWATINLDNLNSNLSSIINKYKNYNYYFGVVKANAYGHGDIEISKEAIKNGINYLAVSSLEEALNIRSELKKINILCLAPINTDYINVAAKNNITITVHDLNYLIDLIKECKMKIKVHIKIDTGMNRLGIKSNNELIEMINLIKENKYLLLEGLYTHMANADNNNEDYYNYQINNFYDLTKNIKLSTFKIIHIGNSATLVNHKKLDFVNGIRLGLIMYGMNPLKNNIDISLKPLFSLKSRIVQIKKLKKGEYVGYSINYKAEEDQIIGIVPIGYADGIIRKNTNRYVSIKNKKYKIIGNICMDMLMVRIDDEIKMDDIVTIIGDDIDINYIANYLDTINYEVLCLISDRVHRIYIKNNRQIKSKSNRFK